MKSKQKGMPCKLRSDSLEADLLKSFSEGEAEAAAAAGGMAGGSCDDGSYLDTHANEGRVHTHTHQTHTHKCNPIHCQPAQTLFTLIMKSKKPPKKTLMCHFLHFSKTSDDIDYLRGMLQNDVPAKHYAPNQTKLGALGWRTLVTTLHNRRVRKQEVWMA